MAAYIIVDVLLMVWVLLLVIIKDYNYCRCATHKGLWVLEEVLEEIKYVVQ